MSKPERLEIIHLVERGDGPCVVVSPAFSRADDLTALIQAIQGAVWSVDGGPDGIGVIAAVKTLVSMAGVEGESAACAWLTGIYEQLCKEAPPEWGQQ